MKAKRPQDKSIDYKYSLELVRSFNKIVEGSPVLRKEFSGRWNLLQSFQSSLFGDAKTWSKEGRLSQVKTDLTGKSKILVTGLLMTLISFLSLIIAFFYRPKLLVFTDDKVEGINHNDSRLDSLYRALDEIRGKFIELVHTIPNREMLKKFTSRLRPVIYLEAIDFIFSPAVFLKKVRIKKILEDVSLEGVAEQDRPFIRSELEKFLSIKSIIRWRVHILTTILRILGIEKVFSIDDTRHYHEIMVASKVLGIPSYAIQHGHFTKYHIGWLNVTDLEGDIIRPDKLLVWSEYWKDELLRLGTYFTNNEILVAGSKSRISETDKVKDERISILIPYEKDAYKDDVRKFIFKVLENKNIEIIFKIREGDISKLEQLEEYGLEGLVGKITAVSSIEDVLERVDLVVGTYSTFLYECVEMLRPVVILKTDMDYGEGMIVNGLADSIDMNKDVMGQVEALSQLGENELRNRRSELVGSQDFTLSDTIHSIVK